MALKLLVPLDGSGLAELVLPWAALLARGRGLSLLLARVWDWPRYGWAVGGDGYLAPEAYEAMLSAERDEAATYLASVQQQWAGEGLAVETVCREGGAAEVLLDLADEYSVAAIALATHGRGGLARWVLGSMAEQLVSHATVPVLLMRAPEGRAPEPSLTRLLVPLDGSPLAERALDLAQAVAPDGAELRLLRVVESIEQPVPDVGSGATYIDEGATRTAMGLAQAYLHRIAKSPGMERLAIETSVRRGRAADEILAVAQDAGTNLIVLCTHGRTGPERLLLGSVTDEVVRRADSAVLLASARALAARVLGSATVRDLMTRDLTAVRADEPIATVLRKLLRRQVGGAPVVDGTGRLVGVVSEYDVLRWELELVGRAAKEPGRPPAEYLQEVGRATAADVMSHPPETIDESASLAAAMRLLVDRRLRRVPVVRDGQLVGILTRSDALRAIAAQWDAVVPPADG